MIKWAVISGLLLTVLSPSQTLATGSWDWLKKPEPAAWKSFFAASPAQRSKQWKELEAKGLSFEQLAWEWRLGWVRSCARSSSKDCSRILQLGLFDKAMVVRAEAASRIGERFAGSGHQPAIRILTTAYGIQQNQRSERPLFVQYRILHALKQIGGNGIEAGQKLALNTAPTKQYWTRIAEREGAIRPH